MTLDVAFTLALLALAFVAFLREWLPIEGTALGLLAVLVLAGAVSPEQAFSGFSSKAVMTIAALFVLAEAVTRTGLLEIAADALTGAFGERPVLALGALLAVAGVLSGVINNTAVVAMLIPLAISLCRRFGVDPKRVLMPLSYVSIIGGTLTLVGTSTNLLVSSIVEDAGQPPLRMFEFSRLGIVFFAVGAGYLAFASRFLRGSSTGPMTEKYDLAPFLSEVGITEASPLVGRTLEEAEVNPRYGVLVLEIRRGGQRIVRGIAAERLAAGDHLVVEGRAEDLARFAREEGIDLLPDIALDDRELSEGGTTTVEVLVHPNALGDLVGSTIRQADFRRRFGGFVLALRRPHGTVRNRLDRVRLQPGDSLLVLMPEDRLQELRDNRDFVVVGELRARLRRVRAWWLVPVLLPAIVVAAALGLAPIHVGAFLAAVLLIVSGVITPQQAYRSINWTVLVLIAAFIPVGQAVVSTGTAAFLADGMLRLGGLVPDAWLPIAVLSLLYLTTSLLTEVVSNAAAAVILGPIALSLGATLGVDPRPFVMAVCFAASASFMTPLGYQTNLMVFGPGGYRFRDYLRIGGPLNLVFWLLATVLIPKMWSF